MYLVVNGSVPNENKPVISFLSTTTNTDISALNVELPGYKYFRCIRAHSSCNGIICLSGVFRIVLWNPATRDFKVIPPSYASLPPFSLRDYSEKEVGFGFDAKTNDYKILETFSGLDDSGHNRFKLYSLHSNSWKKLEPINYVRYYYEFGRATSVSFKDKNTLCWIASALNNELGDRRQIVSLDLSDEKFDIIRLPPHVANSKDNFIWLLFQYRDSIALVCPPPVVDKPRIKFFDIWVNENISTPGTNNSWIKLFSLRVSDVPCGFLYPKGFLGNGQLIFHDDSKKNMILYDLHTREIKQRQIKQQGLFSSIQVFGYKASLVAISKLQK